MTVFGKELSASYAWAIGALGAVGGAVPVMGLFATKPGLVVLASVGCVVALVLVGAVGQGLMKSVSKPVNTSVGGLALVAAVSIAVGIGGGWLVNRPDHSGVAIVPPSPTSSAPSPSALPSTSATSEPSATATPAASTPSQGCPKPLTITSPSSGTSIIGSKGVEVGIAACDLAPGETGWLFDVDADGTFGLDGDGGPVVTADGPLQFDDVPVGNPGDVGEPTKLTLVLANTACATALKAINFDTNQPTSLPAGCVIESQVPIVETYN